MVKDYSKLSKAEILKIVNKQDKELANKKYGLVWDSEKEPEKVVQECAENLPILKNVKGKAIKTNDEEDNLLIEGDNYHALTVLNYTHKEKVDVIYIDPPYNTGNQSWKYNNKFVEKDDGYLHSKWLNMMEKRLVVAKKLLKKEGCLICAIDENEFANLYLLLKKIFGNYNIDQVVIVHNPRGVQGKNFSYNHEYALFIYPKGSNKYIQDIEREEELVEELRDHGGDSLRTNAKNCFYPFLIKNNKIIDIGEVPKENYHPIKKNIKRKNNIFEIWPIDKNGIERKWVFARQSIDNIKENLLIKKRGGEFDVFRTKKEQKPRTVWINQKYDASTHGSKVVKKITRKDFPYPKSIFTVKDCLSTIIKNKLDAIVLDFFAGSGTTGHAVLELNKGDGGKRKFILCTNNEGNICTEICYPRLKNIIKGYNDFKEERVEGLGGNLQYFKTDLIKKSNNRDQIKINLTQECTEMLCVKENVFDLKKESEDFKIFESHKKDKFLCVYYNFIDNSFKNFLKEIKKLKGEKIVYMFSLEDTIDKELFDGIENIKFEAIPQKILEVYKQLIKLNIKK